jgi:hypothetical protein
MKSTTGAFVVTISYNTSGDIPGGCERGSGNDRAQLGVGLGSLSIRFEGKGVNPHHPNSEVIHSNFLVKFIKFVKLPYPIGNYAFKFPPSLCLYPFYLVIDVLVPERMKN